jgi:Reverse transcriptase (RNA-dependent DNA polymerase)
MPITSKAQQCADFRTISLISHVSKIMLHLIKERITPIIHKHLAESQMGFRKGKGTRDAIFQLRMMAEREYRLIRIFIPVMLITRKLLTGVTMKS